MKPFLISAFVVLAATMLMLISVHTSPDSASPSTVVAKEVKLELDEIRLKASHRPKLRIKKAERKLRHAHIETVTKPLLNLQGSHSSRSETSSPNVFKNDIDPYAHIFDALNHYDDEQAAGFADFSSKLEHYFDPAIDNRELTCREGLCRLLVNFHTNEARQTFSNNIDNVLSSSHQKEVWHLPKYDHVFPSVIYVAAHEQTIPNDYSRVNY